MSSVLSITRVQCAPETERSGISASAPFHNKILLNNILHQLNPKVRRNQWQCCLDLIDYSYSKHRPIVLGQVLRIQSIVNLQSCEHRLNVILLCKWRIRPRLLKGGVWGNYDWFQKLEKKNQKVNIGSSFLDHLVQKILFKLITIFPCFFPWQHC